jgi:hypothetical protein
MNYKHTADLKHAGDVVVYLIRRNPWGGSFRASLVWKVLYHTLPHHGPHNLAEDHVRHADRATVVEGCPIVTVERESQRLSGLLGL